VSTNKHQAEESGKEASPGTRERLIQTASLVFGRDGLHKASTRAIAEAAGVSEVTLFRHFKNKEGLLAAVINQFIPHPTDEPQDNSRWKGNLRKNLLQYAEEAYAGMNRNEDFLRTMVGEAKRHPEHAARVIGDAGRPIRDGFIANLGVARSAGKVRKGIDLGLAADVFTSMLLGGMLRKCGDGSCGGEADYSQEKFIATCVDIFIAGLAPSSRA
jgi:AcrR family transcriptional regulator